MSEHSCNIEELFAEMDMRTTKQKHALLEAFDVGRAWSAKQLLKQLGQKWGDASTMHRNLLALKEAGFLRIVINDGKETLYEIVQDAHHDHLKCHTCAIFYCIPCPNPKTPLQRRQKVTRHNIIFEGLCATCH